MGEMIAIRDAYGAALKELGEQVWIIFKVLRIVQQDYVLF